MAMTSSTGKYRIFHRELLGALILVVHGVQGAVFSAIFTVLKYRIEQSCDRYLVNTCNAGCDVTLSDSWSTLFGAPITVYSGAVYLIQCVLGLLAIVRPRVFLPLIRWPVLLLAWLGLLASAVFAARSFGALHAWCTLCTILYLISVATFVGAWAINPGGPIAGLRSGWRRADLETWAVTLAALFVLGTTVVVQSARYQHSAVLTCLEQDYKQLPATTIQLASDGPAEVVAGLFIDLTCRHCRQEFTAWRELHAEHREYLRLDLLHLPMDTTCGAPSIDDSSANQACYGAVALQCMVDQAPDRALEIVEAMYALQDGEGPTFSRDKVDGVRWRLGLADLTACMDRDAGHVRHHVQYALHLGVDAAPAAVVHPVCASPSDTTLRTYIGVKSRRMRELAIQDARRKGVQCNAAQ